MSPRSWRSTLSLFAVLVVIAGLAAGGGYGYLRWNQYTTQRDLQLVAQYLQEEKTAPAETLLTRLWLKAQPSQPWASQLAGMRLKLNQLQGDDVQTVQFAHTILENDPPWAPAGDPVWAEAHSILGQDAIGRKDKSAARTHFEAVLSQSGASPEARNGATLGLARLALAEGDTDAAYEQLSGLMRELDRRDPMWAKAAAILGKLNMARLTSPTPFEGDQVYTVKKGDTLYGLGKKHLVAPDLLMRINRIPSARSLSIGKRLKIPDLDLSIIVDKGTNTLTLLNKGEFFKLYEVRTGKEKYMTPVGTFTVQNKKKDPQWTSPLDHKVYAPGDPENQLGTRWMGFQGSNLGIHEAIDPATIGTYSSNGCVGLMREDVQELYDLLPLGTPITIIDSRDDSPAM